MINTEKASNKIAAVKMIYLASYEKAIKDNSDKINYYRIEFNRLSFAERELSKFNEWGFSNLIYVPVLEHWACVMPNDYKYIEDTSYPYSEEDPPIIFVSGVVDSVLDEYLSEEKGNG